MIFAPLAAVLLAALLLDRRRLLSRPGRALMILGFAVLLGRYLAARIELVLTVAGAGPAAIAWGALALELVCWAGAAATLVQLGARRDRAAEADALEAALRRRPEASLPAVDVVLASRGASAAEAEVAIICARAMDWPAKKLTLRLLDEADDPALARLCAERGVERSAPGRDEERAEWFAREAMRGGGAMTLLVDARLAVQRALLQRLVGMAEQPGIAAVQLAPAFMDPDPLRGRLGPAAAIRRHLRFRLGGLAAGRDGLGCAPFLGMNALLRRDALAGVGAPDGTDAGALRLTLALARQGSEVRFLDEPLAIGAETASMREHLDGEEARAAAAARALFRRDGPLGKGLPWPRRLAMAPLPGVAGLAAHALVIGAPAEHLATGLPLAHLPLEALLSHAAPLFAAAAIAAARLAPAGGAPAALSALGALRSLRLMLAALRHGGRAGAGRARGEPSRGPLTPGARPAGQGADAWAAALAMTATAAAALAVWHAAGLGVADSDSAGARWARADWAGAVPVLALWATLAGQAALGALILAVLPASRRRAARVPADMPAALTTEDGAQLRAWAVDLSILGARLTLDASHGLQAGAKVRARLGGVGEVAAELRHAGGAEAGVRFVGLGAVERDRLIAAIHGGGGARRAASGAPARARGLLADALSRLRGRRRRRRPAPPPLHARAAARVDGA